MGISMEDEESPYQFRNPAPYQFQLLNQQQHRLVPRYHQSVAWCRGARWLQRAEPVRWRGLALDD